VNAKSLLLTVVLSPFKIKPMPIVIRTFRVFVSSTFEDLKQERDALQRALVHSFISFAALA